MSANRTETLAAQRNSLEAGALKPVERTKADRNGSGPLGPGRHATELGEIVRGRADRVMIRYRPCTPAPHSKTSVLNSGGERGTIGGNVSRASRAFAASHSPRPAAAACSPPLPPSHESGLSRRFCCKPARVRNSDWNGFVGRGRTAVRGLNVGPWKSSPPHRKTLSTDHNQGSAVDPQTDCGIRLKHVHNQRPLRSARSRACFNQLAENRPTNARRQVDYSRKELTTWRRRPRPINTQMANTAMSCRWCTSGPVRSPHEHYRETERSSGFERARWFTWRFFA